MSRRNVSLARVATILAAVLVLGALLLLALRLLRPTVQVTVAVEGPVVEAFYATGSVQPDREYDIRSKVAGTLVKVSVDKGQPVQAGQVLALVSSDDLSFRVRQAQAELVEKQKRADEAYSPVLAEFDSNQKAFDEVLAVAQREQQRVLTLLQQNAARQQELDRAIERVQQAWSQAQANRARRGAKKLELDKELAVAQAALDIALFNQEQEKVISPITGVVLDWPVSPGTRVAVNEHLMQLADVRPVNLVMRAAVDEEDKARLQPEQLVQMTLYSFPDQVFAGHVRRIYDKAESERRTFEVDVRVDTAPAQGELSPGMTGELAFILSAKDKATVVPAQAWQQQALWVVRDGLLHKVQAAIGLRSVQRIEVLSGLQPGDQVVISPLGELHPGRKVQVQMIDPLVASELAKEPEKSDTFRAFR